MSRKELSPGLLLGKTTPPVVAYSPQLLFPIARQDARAQLNMDSASLPFTGEDVWHAWEVAWQGNNGLPQLRVARLRLPCTTPNLIESKSLKLYLNSLNGERLGGDADVAAVINSDLSAVAGGDISVELLSPASALLTPAPMPGDCIDDLASVTPAPRPDHSILECCTRRPGQKQETPQVLHSNLLRSLCPVTAQPDWATVIVSMRGNEVSGASLLAYILGFWEHQEFHEQCVERIFCDLNTALQPRELSVQALYTRRGGLDINPYRSSAHGDAPALRHMRQ